MHSWPAMHSWLHSRPAVARQWRRPRRTRPRSTSHHSGYAAKSWRRSRTRRSLQRWCSEGGPLPPKETRCTRASPPQPLPFSLSLLSFLLFSLFSPKKKLFFSLLSSFHFSFFFKLFFSSFEVDFRNIKRRSRLDNRREYGTFPPDCGPEDPLKDLHFLRTNYRGT